VSRTRKSATPPVANRDFPVAGPISTNQNGYVCAYELRGTRAHFDNPFINLTFFGVSDDKIGKN